MGGSTTNVTNTGLGDDQFQTLADNQSGISKQIGTASKEAKTYYDGFNTKFAGLDKSVSGLSTSMADQFKNTNDAMAKYNTALGGRFDSVDKANTANFNALKDVQGTANTISKDVTTGFADQGKRFDTLDQATTDLETGINSGFKDQAAAFSDLNTNVRDNRTALEGQLSEGFADTGDALTKAKTDISGQLTNTQANVLGGQQDLSTALNDLSGTNDIYFDTLATGQANLQSGQDEFRTNFDSYVERYGQDTTLANQTRADIQTAQANAADRIREDLGNYAQATATGQANLSGQLGDVANATGNELDRLGSTVEGGFAATSMQSQQAQQNLTTRLGNVKNLLQQTGDNIDAQTKAQYQSLTNSFDAQGNLIANSIDEQGNTINRSMDDQGNLIETKFDQTGQQIGQTNTNVNQLLSNAGQYQQQITQTMAQNQQGLMGQMDQNQTAAMGQYDQLSQKLAGGFQNLNQADVTQARDLARVAAAQTDMDMGMRQNFQQLGDAFDDTGNLIRNSIDAQGNTISRAVDQNGNLLLKSFDVTGREIGNKVININRSLNDLSNMNNVAGANVSMGNLSPAMQGTVPTSGLMSPFSTTR